MLRLCLAIFYEMFFPESLTLSGGVLLLLKMVKNNNIKNHKREAIYQYLLESIVHGRYRPDDRIPTEQELGEMFTAHRQDAHYAVKQLHQMGILRRQRKQGTFVERVPLPYQMGELKSVTTRRVCVLNTIAPDLQHIHWNQRLISPLENTLREYRIDVQFENISHLSDFTQCSDFLSDLIAHGFNALVLIPHFAADHSEQLSIRPELLFEFHNNVFIFDRGVHRWNDWPYNIVSINVFNEGVMVAQHLLKREIQQIVFCCHPLKNSTWQQERCNGLQYGLYRETQGHQELICSDYIRGQDNPKFFQQVKKWISKGSTALVAENDEAAVDILKVAASLGLEAGKDFSLVGFDDNSKYQSYNLTTVSPSLERIGKTLATMIQSSIDGHDENADLVCTRVDSELIIRATG